MNTNRVKLTPYLALRFVLASRSVMFSGKSFEQGNHESTTSLSHVKYEISVYLYLTGHARAQQRPGETNAQYRSNDDQ